MTHALALGPPFVGLLEEEVELDEVLLEVREELVDEVDVVLDVSEVEVVEPLAVSSDEVDPHPTRARTARPAAARVR